MNALRSLVAELEAERDRIKNRCAEILASLDRMFQDNSELEVKIYQLKAKLVKERSDRCEECGAKVNKTICPVCGAPECCPMCCRIDTLEHQLEHQKQLYAAHIGDEHDNCGVAINQRLLDACEKIHDRICDCEVDDEGWLHPEICVDDFTVLKQAIEAADQHMQRGRKFQPECNRTTNSPCEWSGTPANEDKCRKCGVQFPEWD